MKMPRRRRRFETAAPHLSINNQIKHAHFIRMYLNGNDYNRMVFREEIQTDVIEKIRIHDNTYSGVELEYNALNAY